MAKFPSAVFYATREVRAALETISWPPHPVTGEEPVLAFGDLFTPPTNETVRLIGRIDEPASQDFVTFGVGQSKDEVFALMVLVYTAWPGMSEVETSDRLEELVGLIETSFRSSTTGKPQGLFDAATSADPQCIRWETTTVNPSVYPASEGFAGECWVSLGFKFRL